MKQILLSFLILLSFHLTAQTPPIIYVAADGSGDFNCDGKSDQEEINQALDFVAEHSDFTTVHLKSGLYIIDEPIFISSNTILEGEEGTIVKLVDSANWQTQFKPLIGQKGQKFEASQGDTLITENIIIRGFELDGNRQNQSEPSGNSYYNAIRLMNCRNIVITDMYIHDCLAEGVHIEYENYGFDVNMDFYNNRIHNSGHDGIYVGNCTNFKIHNNIFTDNRTDAHIRVQDCNHFEIYNNICGNNPDRRNSGGTGVYIQAKGDCPVDDAEVYNNYLYGNGVFHGIWLLHDTRYGELNTHKNVHIHHNIISGYQGSGIAIMGFNKTLIENNVIECNGVGTNHALLALTDGIPITPQGGITFYRGDPLNKKISGFVTYVRNNIILYNASYGIVNKKPKIHTFVSEYNCIYGNEKGNYKNASSTTDIYVYPDLAGEYDYDEQVHWYNASAYEVLSPYWREAENDPEVFKTDLGALETINFYHLKSKEGRWDGQQWVNDDVTSFCINTGDPQSDYINEPFPNGGRINIGALGNTEFASKGERIPDIHGFIAYPNPTTGELTISEEFIGNEYFIYTLDGKLVMKGALATNKLDVSALSAGIYLLKIREYGGNGFRVGKFVKI